MPPRDPFKVDLLPGTLDLLILQSLSLGRMHGYGIAQHIGRVSADARQDEEPGRHQGGSSVPAGFRALARPGATAGSP